MNQKKEMPQKRGKGGRPRANNPAANRITVRFTDTEYARFLSMFEQSGLRNKATFVVARVFNEQFRVIKVDRSAVEFTTKLTALYGQFRAVGVNYNQVVKELRSNFSERKAMALLFKLENATLKLAGIGDKIAGLCEEYKKRWLPT